MLETKRALSPDKINAMIFRGRQEGEAHRGLVESLRKLADQDPKTEIGSLEIGKYEPPSDAMRGEFPYGRFPDVKFACGQTRVVLEAQLATITLHGINGRRAFYDRKKACLLWIMRHFDPNSAPRAWLKDITADQQGVLFSLDAEVESLSGADGKFRLRAFFYDFSRKDRLWTEEVISLDRAIEVATPKGWANEFKRRWREAYAGRSYRAEETPDPLGFLNELAARVGLSPFQSSEETECLLSILRLLISLEADEVSGSGHPNLLSLANSFDANGGYRAMTLIVRALDRWKPSFFDRRSMAKALHRANEVLKASRQTQWGRNSAIGKMREALFPEWRLN